MGREIEDEDQSEKHSLAMSRFFMLYDLFLCSFRPGLVAGMLLSIAMVVN